MVDLRNMTPDQIKALAEKMLAEGDIPYGDGDRHGYEFGHCFPAGTLISTPSGAVPIETIRPNDIILSFDESVVRGRGTLVPKRVVRLFHNETEEWLRLTWREDGEDHELTVTPGHRFVDAAGRFRR